MNKILIITFGLFCLSLASNLKSAKQTRESVESVTADDDHLRAYEATWYPDNAPRVIELEGIEIDKTSSVSATVSVVEFVMTTIAQSTVEFLYYEANAEIPANGANISDFNATAFALVLRNFVVYEFVDRNGVEGFQNGTTDQVTGFYDLSDPYLPWKALVINESQIVGADGNSYKLWFVTAETVDEVFALQFVVSGTPIKVGDTKITPDSIKIDFAIRWFTDLHVAANWTTGPSPNISYFETAQVGLLSAFGADALSVEETNGNATANPSLNFASASATGFFSYETSANVTVTGEQIEGEVYATVNAPNSDTEDAFKEGWIVKIIWFSFEGYRPSEVVWDPEFGSEINYPSTSSSNFVQPCIFITFVMWLLFN